MGTVQLVVLSLVPFIMVLGNSMLIPVLPSIQQAVARSDSGVGLLITAFSLVAGITIPIAGFVSDRVGRKKVMVPALVVYGLGGLICGVSALVLAQPFTALLVGRAVQGLGAGGTYQLAMALVGDTLQTRARARALGALESGNGLGKVVSPVAGAALGLLSWIAVFFAYGLLALPAAAAVWFLVKEPSARQAAPPLAHYTEVLTRTFREKGVSLLAGLAGGMMVLFVLFGSLATYSDLLESRFGVLGLRKGLVMAIPVTVMAILSYSTGVMLQKVLNKIAKPVLVIGLALVAAGLIVAPLTFANRTWLILMALIGAGTGLVLPSLNLFFTSSVPVQERGLVTAVYGTSRFWAVAVGPPAFGMAERIGAKPVFWGVAGLAVLTAVGALVLVNPSRVLPRQLQAETTRGGKPASSPAETTGGARPASPAAETGGGGGSASPAPVAGILATQMSPQLQEHPGYTCSDEGAGGDSL